MPWIVYTHGGPNSIKRRAAHERAGIVIHFGFCSARVQAGTGFHSGCPPERGRYKFIIH
jgi:hypothetical protein